MVTNIRIVPPDDENDIWWVFDKDSDRIAVGDTLGEAVERLYNGPVEDDDRIDFNDDPNSWMDSEDYE